MGRFSSDVQRSGLGRSGLGGSGLGDFDPNRSVVNRADAWLTDVYQTRRGEAEEWGEWMQRLETLKEDLKTELARDLPSTLRREGQQILQDVNNEIQRARTQQSELAEDTPDLSY